MFGEKETGLSRLSVRLSFCLISCLAGYARVGRKDASANGIVAIKPQPNSILGLVLSCLPPQLDFRPHQNHDQMHGSGKP